MQVRTARVWCRLGMYLLYMPNRHQTRAVRTCIDFILGKAMPGHILPEAASAP